MIVGLGIDLVGRKRVAQMLDAWDERLLHRLMDEEEIAGLSGSPDRAHALAEAIAAKEAASKALGTGWSRGVRWRDVLLRRDEASHGPEQEARMTAHAIEFRGEAAKRAGHLGSDGRTRLRISSHGDLILAEVWLLAR